MTGGGKSKLAPLEGALVAAGAAAGAANSATAAKTTRRDFRSDGRSRNRSGQQAHDGPRFGSGAGIPHRPQGTNKSPPVPGHCQLSTRDMAKEDLFCAGGAAD